MALRSISLLTSEITDRLDIALMDAVEHDLRDALIRKIEQSAEDIVYTYPASERATRTRRGTIGKKMNLEATAGGGEGHFWLAIKNTAFTQNPAPDDESDIVEEGYATYKQPGPRPFMQNALDDFLDSGEAERILRQVLDRHGL